MTEPFRSLSDAAEWYRAWLCEAALPLWSTVGVDPARGSFQEALSLGGEPWSAPRRARVQSRQAWVFATAARAGLGEGYGEIASAGLRFYLDHYRLADGAFARAADAAGEVVDARVLLYEQAFSLLALAAVHDAAGEDLSAEARRTLGAIERLRHAGGFREPGAEPFQANAQMHLLEAALAWEALEADPWAGLADELVALALTRFISPKTGLLREFFDAEWRALEEGEGGLIEPGHQFEWAWLLDQWTRRRRRTDLADLIARLYDGGARGVDPTRHVAVAAIGEDFGRRDMGARIWAQTERLRAALLMGRQADALDAARGLRGFLETPVRGTWRDKMRADGSFVDEPAPATSLYHLVGGILPLVASHWAGGTS